MLKALNKEVKDNRGFTLIELVIVIAIIGLLVAIAVPRMADARKKAAIATHNANVRTLEGAANMYMAEEGLPDEDFTDAKTKVKDYIQEDGWPKVPKGTGDTTVKDKEGEDYEISIHNDGGITVTPAKIETATTDNSQKGGSET